MGNGLRGSSRGAQGCRGRGSEGPGSLQLLEVLGAARTVLGTSWEVLGGYWMILRGPEDVVKGRKS